MDKRSLRRHMQAVHEQYVQTNLFTCDECAFAHEKVVELEAHMEQQHTSTPPPPILSILQQVLCPGPQIHGAHKQ